MVSSKFSQRLGKTPLTKELQIESIDDDLRNRLWNALKILLFGKINKHAPMGYEAEYDTFCDLLWHNFYKLPIDRIPDFPEHFIRKMFFEGEWYEAYDLIEFIAAVDTDITNINKPEFIDTCNNILENEFSGYRFINNIIAPITNEHEIDEIKGAINNTFQFTSLAGANIHLNEALEKLSNRKNPDYRNSIKESISAIESIAKVIAESSSDSLGNALSNLKNKIDLHPALEKGFKQLYGYTSDKDGIRHALMEASSCDFEDAKYMLISCSAFINYIITKAQKAGINII